MIDWAYIEQQFHLVYAQLLPEKASSQWCIEPQGLKPTNHKTKYGMADINGFVHINKAFVGTSAVNLLDATIRHELAHLCVGLQHGHDQYFKATAKLFKADFGQHLKHESKQVHEAIGYKYLLFACLANQDEILFRRAHRKHPKYLNYKPGRFKYLTIKGEKVLGFKYQLV